MDKQETAVYELGLPGGMATLRTSIDEIWKELKNPSSETYQEALRHGINPATLPDTYDSVLHMSKSAAKFDPSAADITLVFVSGALTTVAKDVWKYIMLPRLRHRFGDKALCERSKKDSAGKNR